MVTNSKRGLSVVIALSLILFFSCGRKCEVYPLYFENTSFPFPSDYRTPDFIENGYSPLQSMIITFNKTFSISLPPEESLSPAFPFFLISLDSMKRIPVKVESFTYDPLKIKPLKQGIVRIRPLIALEPGGRYIFGLTENATNSLCASSIFEKSLKLSDEYHISLKESMTAIKNAGLVEGKIVLASTFTVKDEEDLTLQLYRISHTQYIAPHVEIDSLLPCTGKGEESPYCREEGLPQMIVHGYFTSSDFIGYGPSTQVFEGETPRAFYKVPFILAVGKGRDTPVVIFQHGFGDSKEAMFRELAYTLNREGFSVIGMDIVFHGERKLPPEESMGLPHLDIMAVNLENLTVDAKRARDHIRQTVIDQIHLARSLYNGLLNDPDNDGVNEINGREIYYVGQSLGGILGTIFTSLFPHLKASVISVGGGSFIDILEGYKELQILLVIFTKDMNFISRLMFLEEMQAKMDKADPANYAGHIIKKPFEKRTIPHILLQEAVNDPIVSNESTEILARTMGIPLAIPSFTQPPFMEGVKTPVFMNISTESGTITGALFQFHPAEHGFLLTPEETQPWDKAQKQIVHFFKGKEIIDPYER